MKERKWFTQIFQYLANCINSTGLESWSFQSNQHITTPILSKAHIHKKQH